jgi:ribosome recycling factor
MQNVLEDGKKKMQGALASLNKELGKLRTGRASASLVENLKVEYYGNPTVLSQIASISVPDSRTVTIQPWDRGAFGDIDKAIQKSDLGLNPVNDGKLIRINIPPLTEDRRKDLAKVAKKYAEEAKVHVRTVRRDLNEALKKLQKDKAITEDDVRTGQEKVQKLTDDTVKECDKVLAAKEKEIMEI